MFNTNNRLFDEFAKAATDAVGALSGMRGQVRSEIRSHVNRLISDMDFVPRADFEIVESMARESRMQNQALEKRLAVLERQLADPVRKAAAKTAVKTVAVTADKKSARKKKV